MLKLPRPGSLGASTSMPPPASCSPLSGKSSWNTNTESFDGGKGFGCTNTLNCAGKAPVVAVHTTDPAAGTQAIGAPPMPWPRRGVGGAGRVDVEGAVFLDDPAVVSDRGCLVLAIENIEGDTGGCREGQRHGRGGCGDSSLRVLRPEGERVGARPNDGRVEATVRIDG